MKLSRYSSAKDWTGRDDASGDERMHQCVRTMNITDLTKASEKTFAFVGFCSDEGIRRNKGRAGAFQGPEAIRKQLANLPWGKKNLIDIGDIVCTDGDLESSQKELGETVSQVLKLNCTPIVLGGGHETAWGHFQGLAEAGSFPLIINFDAHYDLRPYTDKGNSGTPFLQISELCKSRKQKFSYMCIGAQKTSNTVSLHKKANDLHVDTVFAETLHLEGVNSTLSLLEKKLAMHDSVYVTLCMDVFAQAYAPGVSAPQALGLLPWQVIPLLRKIVASKKMISADCVEVSPPFDNDSQTSKLAASLLWELLS